MKTTRRASVLVGVSLAWSWLAACSDLPTDVAPDFAVDLAEPWSVAEASEVGMNGDELFVAGELAGRIERIRSLVVVRSGRLVYERYFGGSTADTLADVRSVTKSIVSTLVGVAIEEGHIEGLDQPIRHFLRAPAFPVRPEHAGITVRHLLTMTGGFEWNEAGTGYNDWVLSGDHIAYLLDRPVSAVPGRDFTYNSAAVHLLGVVLEQATGDSLEDYADRVLLGPLGIAESRWESLTDGYVNGGSGMDLRPRDLARLGQLFLQLGWSGRDRLLPRGWVREATRPRFPAFHSVGPIRRLSYGYLWWLDLDREAFLAWGYAGQFVYVAPAAELVVVMTTDWQGVSQDIGSRRLQEEVLNIIVARVLPATS